MAKCNKCGKGSDIWSCDLAFQTSNQPPVPTELAKSFYYERARSHGSIHYVHQMHQSIGQGALIS